MAKVTFKGNPIETVGNLPPKGKKAPDFKLIKNDLEEASLEDFSGRKKVLNIFVSLDTGVCATSIKKFYKFLKGKKDVVLLNISKDLPFAAKRFCESEKLDNCIALSAFRSHFPQDYGVEIAAGPLKGLCSRAVVVLDEKNQVIYEEQVSEITHEPSYEKVMEVL